ncbi:hypothetical protein ACFOEE_16890 [Pseudoalteromonas fenneropenaei]|uniref:DUF883 domain-containing protein n=1 Tax=Pseudoalteromonas fenneropenaei TaxID=1737459 RepID=A0ABV7CNF8_9GAMM
MATSKANPADKTNGIAAHHPISDSIAESLHGSVDALHHSGAKAETLLRDKSEHSKVALDEQLNAIKHAWQGSGVKKYASENPLKTAGIAFSVGIVATLLLSKR